MTRIPVHTYDSAPEAAKPTLEKLQARYGKLLNIHAEMAHAPIVLEAYAAMNAAIARHSTFDARTREAIALAVGAVDECRYCQSAHTLSARAAGMTEAQTVAIRQGAAEFDPRLNALLAVARQIAGNVGEVTDDAWNLAVGAGWSDAELAELFAHVAANLFTNYFNHYADTELDVPPAPGL